LPALTGKRIVFISPQAWGNMKLSKHYYAIELTKRGNEVFYLVPAKNNLNPKIKIVPSTEYQGLFFVHFSILLPYFLKFKWPSFFQKGMEIHAVQIRKAIGHPIDIVWDFDCNFLFHNLSPFQPKTIIFHPVDQGHEAPVTKKPSIIFSVSDIILDSQRHLGAPSYFINHGLGPQFSELAKRELHNLTNDAFDKLQKPQNIGYIGNLKHPAIDRKILINIIQNHPKLHFHFFGPYELSAQEGKNTALHHFIHFLKNAENVTLYGLQDQKKIIKFNKIIDIYLATYKKTKHYNADNSHKILEYLSTGKIVVSNLLSTYKESELFLMPKTFSNQNLPELFEESINNWSDFHTLEKRKARIQFALDHSYDRQLDKIEERLVHHQLI
jgi:hypothetical protein